MKLHVLGCYGPYPDAGGATSGYLIEHEGKCLLMDCGAGVLGKLMEKCDPASLQCVLLSHLHFDHASDLLVLRYYLEKWGKKLTLYVPPQDQSHLLQLLQTPAFAVLPYPEELQVMGLTVTTLPVRHPVPCRAIRLTDGDKTLVFTGDSNLCPALAGFAKDADVLLADGAFLETEWSEKAPHMSAYHCGLLAAEANVKKLYVTHLSSSHAAEEFETDARRAFENARAVRPGQVIAL